MVKFIPIEELRKIRSKEAFDKKQKELEHQSNLPIEINEYNLGQNIKVL